MWIIPAGRMKAGKEHQVALSKAAMEVLKKVRALTEKIGGGVGASNLVFPNDQIRKSVIGKFTHVAFEAHEIRPRHHARFSFGIPRLGR